MGNRATQLRRLMNGTELVIAPGAYDGLSARLIERAGFPALHITGGGVSAGVFGHPDIGLTTMTEMVETCRRIVAATTIPAISDADAGFGNALNLMRTVREMEAAGVAGIHVEDETIPRPFGSAGKIELLSREEMVKKIEAAREARTDPDFVIVGRTDALMAGDLEEALVRARLLAAAGADLVYAEGIRTVDVVERLAREVKAPLFLNLEGIAPHLPGLDLWRLGYRIGIFSSTPQRVAAQAMQEALEVIRREGTTLSLQPKALPFESRAELVGESAVKSLQERFLRA